MNKAGAWLAIGVLDVVALNLWVVPELGGAPSAAGAAAALATAAPRPVRVAVAPDPPAAAPVAVVVEPEPAPAPVAAVVEPEPAPAPVAAVVEPEPAPAPVAAVVEPEPAPAPVAVAAEPEPAPAPVAVAVEPEPALAAPEAPDRVVIRFGFDRATILPVAARHLDQLHQVLVDHPSWTLTVTGDASPDGDDDHNRQLSMRRARRIQEYLAARGVDAARVELHGRGSAGDARRTATITVVERP
ncbi:MAG: OmpA family protein [Kofleriaceae bacterium]